MSVHSYHDSSYWIIVFKSKTVCCFLVRPNRTVLLECIMRKKITLEMYSFRFQKLGLSWSTCPYDETEKLYRLVYVDIVCINNLYSPFRACQKYGGAASASVVVVLPCWARYLVICSFTVRRNWNWFLSPHKSYYAWKYSLSVSSILNCLEWCRAFCVLFFYSQYYSWKCKA